MLGQKQIEAAVAYNDDRDRGDERDFALLVAGFQQAHNLTVDGQLGPRTAAVLKAQRADSAPPIVTASGMPGQYWARFDGPLEFRPVTWKECIQVYGNPANERGLEDASWFARNIVERGPSHPFPGMYTEGPGRYVQVHRLVEPYVDEGFRRGAVAAPSYKLRRVGGYNFRRIRHDTPAKAAARNHHPPLRQLSRHALGAALDIDPDNNRAIEFDNPADTPAPWSAEWMKIWPLGIPKAFVEAMESVGFRWGGRWRGFCDPMHMELAGGPAHAQL